MDFKAFEKMSYGLYLISSQDEGRRAGCVVNTFIQVTSQPVQVTVTINKDNYTEKVIEKTGRFTAVALSQSAEMNLIGAFGFHSSADTDKFEGFRTERDLNGIPYVTEQTAARFSCEVVKTMDAGTHVIFLAKVLETEVLDDTAPMTYAYYHEIKKGVTPPKASSYTPPAVTGYRCRICGYILEADTIPEDFKCPICGRDKEYLEKFAG